MGWRKWKKEDEDIPQGTSVKIDKYFGNLSGKIGKVDEPAAASDFSIVKIAGKRHSFHNSDLWIKTEVFGEAIKNESFPKQIIGNNDIVYKKEYEKNQSGGKIAHYNLYYKGYDIDPGGYTFKSMEEMKAFMKQYVLSNNLYNKYKHMPKKNIGENMKQPEYKIREAIRKEISKMLSEGKANRVKILKEAKMLNEAFDIKKAFGGKTRLETGFTKVVLVKNKLVITHAGNMGNSIKSSVNPNLKRLGILPIEKLKKLYSTEEETGSPDYLYYIRFNIKTDEIVEGMGEYNNLPDSNSYHKVIKPFDIWVYVGNEHRGEHYGNSKIYRGVYKKTKAKNGDEIHNLPGGLFYVPKVGNPVSMKTSEPTDRGAFEHGRDFNGFDLGKLSDIPEGQQKRVSYR